MPRSSHPPAAGPPASDPSFPERSAPGPEDDVDELGFLFAEIVEDLPEFVPRYLELVETGGDDPGEPVVLMELADFVAARLAAEVGEASALERALGLVESLLRERAGDGAATELIGCAFFDTFTVEDRRRLALRLGPRSLGVLEDLELADPGVPGG